MLLRIIDKPDQNNNEALVEIIFENGGRTIRFESEYYPSPLSTQFKKDLNWYFSSYLHELKDISNDHRVSEKLLSLGRYMGDQLLGEDHELIQVKEAIEALGYEHLSVSIESSRIAFFQEQWEALILPDASFVLSSVCKDFSRRFLMGGIPQYDSELNYELSKETPLTLLHIVSRSEGIDSTTTSSQSFNAFTNTLSFDGAIRYEILSSPSWEKIHNRLNNSEYPVHIVHFDGRIAFTDGTPNLLLEESSREAESLPVKALAEAMKQNSAALLCIESQGYIEATDTSVIDSDIALAAVAHVALSQGVSNIIGTHNLSLPEVTSRCFSYIINCIASGFEVGQAVVEARKKLQIHTVSRDYVNQDKPFQYWSIPTLYRCKPTTFFAAPQTHAVLYEMESYNDLRKRLFGFKDDLLHPNASVTSDRQFPTVLNALKNQLPVYIGSGEGCGKTSLAHQTVFYLGALGSIQFGFYFDYFSEFYTREDVLQMINPILSPERMESTSCCFVFDNIDTLTIANNDGQELESLLTLVEELLKQGHKIIMTGQSSQGVFSSCFEVNINKPSRLELQHHLSSLLDKSGITNILIDTDLLDLFDSIGGNPFLLEKMIPQLDKNTINEIAVEIREVFGSKVDKNVSDFAVRTFFQWQWNKLPESHQKLFMVLVDIPGILLEMIDVVANKPVEGNPVNELLSVISADGVAFSDALDRYTQSGFLQQHPHGRVIFPRFIALVKANRDKDTVFQTSGALISQLLSKVLCTAVIALVPHLQSQQGAPIKQNLLINRGRWAQHLESLWIAKEYDVFLQAKGALFGLMKQEGLGSECAEWSFDVVNRFDAVIPGTSSHDSLLEQVAWLTLATDALEKNDSQSQPHRKQSAEQWLVWLESDQADDNLPLKVSAIQFLDSYYLKTANWELCKSVNERARDIYQQRRMWSKFIQCSKTLAHCYFQLEEIVHGLKVEADMFDLPPFEKDMDGYKVQLTIETVASRIAHNLLIEAQQLLDTFKVPDAHDSMTMAITSLQSEIFIKEGRVDEAVPLLQQLHSAYLNQGHNDAAAGIQDKIDSLVNRLVRA